MEDGSGFPPNYPDLLIFNEYAKDGYIVVTDQMRVGVLIDMPDFTEPVVPVFWYDSQVAGEVAVDSVARVYSDDVLVLRRDDAGLHIVPPEEQGVDPRVTDR